MSAIQVELVSGSPPERATRDKFLEIRSRLDLTRFEFTHQIRIEEGAIPHSHPVLALGTGSPHDVALLASYLHEQLHWFVWQRESARPEAAEVLSAELRKQYPHPPVGLPEGAADEESSYLHYVVNHLELLSWRSCWGGSVQSATSRASPSTRRSTRRSSGTEGR